MFLSAYRDLKPSGLRLVFFFTERFGLKLSGLITFPLASSNFVDALFEKLPLLLELLSGCFGAIVIV